MNVRKDLKNLLIPNSFVLKGRTFRGFQALPPQEAQRLYVGLMKYGNACGCDEGALGTLLAICTYLLVSTVLPFLLSEPLTATWQWGVAAAVTGGAVGKSVGLWWAHYRFENLRRQFEVLADTNQTGGI